MPAVPSVCPHLSKNFLNRAEIKGGKEQRCYNREIREEKRMKKCKETRVVTATQRRTEDQGEGTKAGRREGTRHFSPFPLHQPGPRQGEHPALDPRELLLPPAAPNSPPKPWGERDWPCTTAAPSPPCPAARVPRPRALQAANRLVSHGGKMEAGREKEQGTTRGFPLLLQPPVLWGGPRKEQISDCCSLHQGTGGPRKGNTEAGPDHTPPPWHGHVLPSAPSTGAAGTSC